MKIILSFLNCDESIVLKIKTKTRPNVGDGIWLQDFKKLEGLSKDLLKDIQEKSRFVVTDVVFGKIHEHKKKRWVIQGELE